MTPVYGNILVATTTYFANEKFQFIQKRALGAQLAVLVLSAFFQQYIDQREPKHLKLGYFVTSLFLGLAGYFSGLNHRVNFLATGILIFSQLIFGYCFSAESAVLIPSSNVTASPRVEWSQLDEIELRSIVEAIDDKYQEYEKMENPPEGYVVNIFHGNERFDVRPSGGTRAKGSLLSGSPIKHPSGCPLCAKETRAFIIEPRFKLIKSLNNRPLIINEPPTVNWFQMPIEDQVGRLLAAQKIYRNLAENIDKTGLFLELHCGYSAGQREWHTHLRFERPGGWRGISWWNEMISL